LGDLTNITTQDSLRSEIRRLTQILGVEPRVVVHDLHPDYFTSRLALELRSERGLKLVGVQHHHAHLASCLAENDFPPDHPVLGVLFDGTGYGLDGTIWGGEFLVGSYDGFRRVAHLRPVALPGGEAAIRSPFRSALAYLLDAMGPDALELDLPAFAKRPRKLLEDLAQMIRSDLACPRSSGMGRLFDAVAAILALPGGIADVVSYEAQPAMELEAAAARAEHCIEKADVYAFELTTTGEVDCRPLILSVLDDLSRGREVPTIAARFHATIIRLASEVAARAAAEEDLRHIVLSGGCFHNRFLAGRVAHDLRRRGYQVLSQQRFPCGDGGLALGQAAVAASRYNRGN
jgi:hydrogenase maturation protein HypF